MLSFTNSKINHLAVVSLRAFRSFMKSGVGAALGKEIPLEMKNSYNGGVTMLNGIATALGRTDLLLPELHSTYGSAIKAANSWVELATVLNQDLAFKLYDPLYDAFSLLPPGDSSTSEWITALSAINPGLARKVEDIIERFQTSMPGMVNSQMATMNDYVHFPGLQLLASGRDTKTKKLALLDSEADQMKMVADVVRRHGWKRHVGSFPGKASYSTYIANLNDGGGGAGTGIPIERLVPAEVLALTGVVTIDMVAEDDPGVSTFNGLAIDNYSAGDGYFYTASGSLTGAIGADWISANPVGGTFTISIHYTEYIYRNSAGDLIQADSSTRFSVLYQDDAGFGGMPSIFPTYRSRFFDAIGIYGSTLMSLIVELQPAFLGAVGNVADVYNYMTTANGNAERLADWIDLLSAEILTESKIGDAARDYLGLC
jgi:hypothetical protein